MRCSWWNKGGGYKEYVATSVGRSIHGAQSLPCFGDALVQGSMIGEKVGMHESDVAIRE